MQTHQLLAEHLATGYDGKHVIPNLDITLQSGKINMIIGPNGCGKSTLLKAFCKLNQVYGGAILLDGKNIQSYRSREFAQALGLLPQSPIVPEGISVVELVSRGRFPYRTLMKGLGRSDYAAIDEAIDTMGIREIADRNVDELSGGQRQRVWIALALAQQTDILFLDEPTTYLDIAYQIEILELLLRLNREKGVTIVMVLHDINYAARYADCIFAMKNGELVAQGTPKDIVTEALMYEVYGMQCCIVTDPVYHTPNVIPVGHPELMKKAGKRPLSNSNDGCHCLEAI